MAIERLIIGSTNPGKSNEWKKLLGDSIETTSIGDLGTFSDPKETGKTFLENAELKAKYYALLTKEFVLADDGGFEIDALGGEPGIKSRRILPGDKDGTDEELINYVLNRMKGVSKEKRTARLVVYAAISDKDGNIIFSDFGEIKGLITEKAAQILIPGYPYRSILYLPEVGKTYAELSNDEHEKLNHRRKIAINILGFIANNK